ncbi:hypothetical protein ACGFIV_32340 [Sphaerisporangium sp. NPDC049003]|uniref:hypothetical protein n=1 Tax=Sphaerisporangium sp. NPDC049003 TaxID=3364517 RepID=UPI00371CE109
MGTIASQHIITTHNLAGRRVLVQQTAWTSGGVSFDVLDTATGATLTLAGSFVAPPSPEQITAVLAGLDPSEFGPPARPRRPATVTMSTARSGPCVRGAAAAARARLGDTELLGWVVGATLAERYDEELPFAIETIQDVDRFQREVCDAIPDGYTHPIEQIRVWPSSGEPDALITLDLPTGLRLATLTVQAWQFVAPSPGAGTRENIEFAFAELLYQGHRLAEEFERTVNAVRPQPWWRRRRPPGGGRHGLLGGRAA